MGKICQSVYHVWRKMRGEICKLQLQISGLPIAGTLSKQIYLVAMDREEILEQIELQEGKGALQKQLPAGNLWALVSMGIGLLCFTVKKLRQ